MTRNRIANVHNKYQRTEKFRRILCVCSAGLLRSPTMAFVLSQPPYNANTRAVGCDIEYALIPIDDALVEWADEIVCANYDHLESVTNKWPDRTVINLNLPDEYDYRDETLIELIKRRYDDADL